MVCFEPPLACGTLHSQGDWKALQPSRLYKMSVDHRNVLRITTPQLDQFPMKVGTEPTHSVNLRLDLPKLLK